MSRVLGIDSECMSFTNIKGDLKLYIEVDERLKTVCAHEHEIIRPGF